MNNTNTIAKQQYNLPRHWYAKEIQAWENAGNITSWGTATNEFEPDTTVTFNIPDNIQSCMKKRMEMPPTTVQTTPSLLTGKKRVRLG
jgi:hypothetical protein